jgi:lipoyl(octanoyl) transferase
MDLWVCHLGRVEYREAAALQERLRERVIAGELPDLMLLLEHPPVYTIGRRSDEGDLPFGEAFYRDRGIDIVRTPRGGQLTYHGPGQLVGYPILDLGPRPDAARYLRDLEEVVIRTGADLGVALDRREDVQTGVWHGDDKICAIGVRLMRARVTLHGFALNCDTDLSWFRGIVPCGLPDHGATSLSTLLGHRVRVEEVRPIVESHFAVVFERELSNAPTVEIEPFRAVALAG